ncbi:MAG: preprotein translocase subunit SecA, partial [Actinomycetota bacterium]
AAGGGGAATATLAMSGGGTTSTAGAPRPIVKSEKENIGRNDPCWCGSGKKFKKCHGA